MQFRSDKDLFPVAETDLTLIFPREFLTSRRGGNAPNIQKKLEARISRTEALDTDSNPMQVYRLRRTKEIWKKRIIN